MHAQAPQTQAAAHKALMKWILLYQQCTGHLAQWTTMNNSARRAAIDRREEMRGGKVERRWEASGRKQEGSGRTGEWELAKMRVAEEGGETQEGNNQSCWVKWEEICAFLTIQRALCAALCRCLCTNTLGRPSRARLCYLPLSSHHPRCSASLLKLLQAHVLW